MNTTSRLVATPEPPDVLSVEITTRCNFKCKMCALVTGGTRSSAEAGHMESAVWHRIVEAAEAVGHINVNGWGENFYHPEFLDFLEQLDAAGVSTNFSTNGTFLTSEIVQRLGRLRHLRQINVSIDSPDPETFFAIRKGSLAAVLKGLEFLIRGLPHPERVTVSSVVMESTYESLEAFPPILARLGVRGYVLQGMVDAAGTLADERLVPRPEILAVVERVRNHCRELGIDVLVVPYLGSQLDDREPEIWSKEVAHQTRRLRPAADGEPQTRLCSSPWDHVFVNKDGLVLPCCNCPPWEQSAADGQGVMGDLNTQSFQEIWHGERFARFRHDLLFGPNPSICETCSVTSSGRHFFRQIAAEIEERACSGRRSRLFLVVRNAGEIPWTRETGLRIGTAQPRDRPSRLAHPSWRSLWRTETFRERSVLPGERATFKIRLAPGAGMPPESFQLVADGVCWLPGTRFEIGPPARFTGRRTLRFSAS
ncbi:MAG TPA: radical SAM protein [Thermoanaerobaculia bacterium]|jgi:MoaA/NifB/PqqE/SkfB family radical SAM enzyme|nr:radical SAM protein [Thermoanaerobaculia bacterium]